MEREVRKTWSDEARARHKAGVARYQKERGEHEVLRIVCDFAREIGVNVNALLKTLIATGNERLWKMSEIEPREERLRAFKNLVVDYYGGVTA